MKKKKKKKRKTGIVPEAESRRKGTWYKMRLVSQNSGKQEVMLGLKTFYPNVSK